MLQSTGPGKYKVWSMQPSQAKRYQNLSVHLHVLVTFNNTFILFLVAGTSTKIKDNYDKSRFRIAFGYSYCDVRLFRETKSTKEPAT